MPARLCQVQQIRVLAGEQHDQVPKVPTPSFQSKKESKPSALFANFFDCLLIFWCTVVLCYAVQVFWYFPLKNQLETLLRSAKYQYLLLHETRWARSLGLMTDVFDTPSWRKVAGPPTKHLTSIVYQICVDGFPWSKRKHLVCTSCLLSSCLLLVALLNLELLAVGIANC